MKRIILIALLIIGIIYIITVTLLIFALPFILPKEILNFHPAWGVTIITAFGLYAIIKIRKNK